MAHSEPPYLFAAADQKYFSHYLEKKVSENYRFFILIDENTKKYCYKKLIKDFPVLADAKEIIIKSGEKEKTLETCNYIFTKLIENHADRYSILINLGGGVITDMGGFAASVYKRGIAFCNVPTSLLAMVDAAVGGKTGLDFDGLKNAIGCFNIAEKTYIDPGFLNTLPERHLRSGYAELFKIALVSDKLLWKKLMKLDFKTITDSQDIIKKAVELKNHIVMQDPTEKGFRKVLNFGHTIGHAVESYSLMHDKKPLLHGEAIAIGMICESWLSYKTMALPEKDLEQISTKLIECFGKVKLVAEKMNLLKLMQNDKKNRKQVKSFSLLSGIGIPSIDCLPSDRLITESLDFYLNL